MRNCHSIVPALALLLAACGGGSGQGLDVSGRPIDEGGGTQPRTPGANFESIQANVFTPICTVCHAGGSAPVGLKLDADNAFAMLVNVASVEVPGLLRVNPGNPDDSYLVQKIEGTAAVGGQMPLGGPPLDSQAIAAIRQWIADGALPPGSSTAAPKVTSVTPAAGATVTDVLTTLSATFSEAMDAGLVSDLTFTLTASGGDGTFGDGNETQVVPVAVTLANAQAIEMDLAGIVLADDVYEARLVGTGATALASVTGRVLDGDDDGADGGDFAWQFSLATATPSPAATWRWIQDNVFTPICAQCHVAGGIADFLLLDADHSFAATVNVPSTEVAALDRIEPGDPDASYLVQKLEGTAAVGARMPLGLDPLAPDVVAAIRAWIAAGVPLAPGDPMPGPGADVEPPTIVINALPSPASGLVDVGFAATDNIGVTAVRFYVDGTLVATATSTPFSVGWDTTLLPDGTHTLRAEAEDAAGNVGSSPELTVEVRNLSADLLPPTVAIVAPAGPVSGTVFLEAEATDDVAVASVTLTVDGVALGTDALPPYRFEWDTTAAADGPHTLDATATDTSGNVGTATPVEVVVDNTVPADTVAPLVAIVTPPRPLSGIALLDLHASDDRGVALVRLFVGEVLAGTTAVAPYLIDLDTTTVADGIHTLRAEALDAAGNVGASEPVEVEIRNAGGPQPTWRWIQDNVFTPACVSCHRGGGIASFLWLDEASSHAQLVGVPTTEGGPPLRVDAGNPDSSALIQRVEGTLTPRMPLGGAALGADVIAAMREWIALGAAPEIPPDVSPPTVALVAPGATVSGVVTISAEVSDDVGVAALRFFVNGELAASRAAAPWEFTWDTTAIADGTYEIGAAADDTSGNSASAEPVLVLVDNDLPPDAEAPFVAIRPPAATLVGVVPVEIDATDNVGVTLVTLSVDGNLLGTRSSAPYIIEWDTLGVVNGDYTLVATASDAAGNTGASEPVAVTVANTEPVLALSLDVPPNVERGDDFSVVATLANSGADAPPLEATLSFAPPDALRIEAGAMTQSLGSVPSGGGAVVSWLMRADESGVATVTVVVKDAAGDIDVIETAEIAVSD